jgi:dihydrofolate reductase
MGELVVSMFVTVDGVIQGPGAPKEDTEGGFRQGGWQAPYFDEESGELITKDIQRIDALVLGRKTYDIFATYWPKAPKDPISTKLNSVPKYVASRTLKKVDWQNSSLIHGDVAKEIPKIKQRHHEIQVIGSANLAQTLLKHDLVDRYNLWVYPVILGSGKKLFADGAAPSALELVKSATFSKGAVMLQYKRVGKPTYVDITAQTAGTH